MIKHIARLAAVAPAAVALALGLAAAPAASAASAAQASTVRPNVPSLCGWHPANDSHAPGFAGTDTIYSGQGSSCSTTLALWGDYVVVHCYAYSGGREWFYLYDAANGVTGWMNASSVSAVYPGAC
jgi:hypothetical protein